MAVAAAASTSKPAGYVAGVALPGGATVRVASTNQLAAFTLFEVKDPFVQQVDDQTATGSAATPRLRRQPTPPRRMAPPLRPIPEPPAAATPEPVVYATIMFDGKPQQLKVKQKFPTKSTRSSSSSR